jgi:hypothetical protein
VLFAGIICAGPTDDGGELNSMNFSSARPDVVRAINQRWLLKFWHRHQGDQNVPAWRAVEAEDLTRLSANLSFLTVMAVDGKPRFQITYHGEMVGKVYGSDDCRGRLLDQVIPQANHAMGLAPYYRAVASARPVYTICDVKDRNGRLVHMERLLLPFSTNGGDIDRVLVSFEFICEDGAFDSDGLMKSQSSPPTFRVSATIDVAGVAG